MTNEQLEVLKKYGIDKEYIYEDENRIRIIIPQDEYFNYYKEWISYLSENEWFESKYLNGNADTDITRI